MGGQGKLHDICMSGIESNFFAAYMQLEKCCNNDVMSSNIHLLL